MSPGRTSSTVPIPFCLLGTKRSEGDQPWRFVCRTFSDFAIPSSIAHSTLVPFSKLTPLINSSHSRRMLRSEVSSLFRAYIWQSAQSFSSSLAPPNVKHAAVTASSLTRLSTSIAFATFSASAACERSRSASLSRASSVLLQSVSDISE